MDHLHPAFALALFVEAFLVLHVIRRWIRIELIPGRSSTIDGLRGFLAFGVFVHHAAIWYVFLKTGSWVVPESRLYSQLGQATVTLFFMITGFLFYSKVLESREKPIDWLRLYVSRCLRILPLYVAILIFAALLIVLIRYSGWVSPMVAPWNQKSLVGLITAGVTWTLGYEWKFYYSLPLLALTVGRVPWRWLVFSLLMLAISGITKALDIHACAFVGGIAAALLGQVAAWRRFARSAWGSAGALLTLACAVAGFDTADVVAPLVLMAMSFALIANGAGMWGLLETELPRIFGEMTYSIYLLHGPLLFIAFHFVLGFDQGANLNPMQHWSVIALLVPIVLAVSAFSYINLEAPCMRKVSNCQAYLNKFGSLISAWGGKLVKIFNILKSRI